MIRSDLWRASRLLNIDARRLVLAVLAGIAASGSALALAALAAWLIARAWQMPPVLDLSVAVVSVRALGISRGLFRYLERLATHDAGFRGTTAARAGIYRRLAAGDSAAVTSLRSGDLLSRTGRDVDTVGEVVVRGLVPIAVAAVLSVTAVVMLGAIAPVAGAVLAVSLVVAGVAVPTMAARAARRAEEASIKSSADYAALAMTSLEHAAELRVAGRLDTVLAAAKSAAHRNGAAIDASAARTATAAAGTPLAIGTSLLAALLVAVVASDGMTPMALAVLVLVPLSAFEAVAPLPAAATALIRARIAATRIMAMLDKSSRVESHGARPVPASTELAAQALVCGHPGGKCAPAVDFVAQPGERVAVIGASGIGKTTLLATLAGLVDPVCGSITVGGVDVADVDANELRRRVTFFAEDAHLFDTSLLENLRVADGDLDADSAVRALRSVGLGRWLDGLPDGVDTVLTGGARAVSGGQRRRILLARALVSPAEVLLLDEPTEHMDADDGARLLSALLDRDSGLLSPARTAIVVTHQLPESTAADKVISLDFSRRENPLPSR